MSTYVRRADPAAGRQLWHRLAAATAWLVDHDHAPPCATGSDDWYSERRRTRTIAARICRAHCPLLDLCRDYADTAGERFGVWGGVDHGRG